MKIAFMGTPDFAVPSLERLHKDGHELCAAFTQPDKPRGRGMKLAFSPVKEFALAHNLPVFQPENFKDGVALAQLQALAPELIVVVAYGRILPPSVLELPRHGCINVHASLLPRYRGSAPINWAILNGETETGVTIMHLAPEMDTGDMILSKATPIGPEENAQQLYGRLKDMGADLLSEAVCRLASGSAPRTAQEHESASYAPMLTRELSAVDWSRTAQELHNQIRGLIPWPTAVARIQDKSFKLYCSQPVESPRAALKTPGSVLFAGEQGLDIACGGGTALRITQLQVEGGKRMHVSDYLRGHPMEAD